MKEEGWDVTVVTTLPHKSNVKIEKNTDKNIHRIEVKKVIKKNFFSYLQNDFGFMFSSKKYVNKYLKNQKYDYVVVSSPPIFVALTGYWLSKRKNANFILDIRDLWPDSVVSTGFLKKESLIYKFSKHLEKFLYNKATYITCVSKMMKEEITQSLKNDNVSIVYNGVSDKEKHEVLKNNEFIKQDQNSNRVNITYTGNIGLVQGLDILIEAFEKMNDKERKKYQLNIIGDGVEKEKLESRVKESGLEEEIVFWGSLPKEEALKKSMYADLLFLNLIQDETLEKTIPSKLFDYLLLNKPILSSIKGEGNQILEKLGCYISFDSKDATTLISALDYYEQNKELLEKRAQGNFSFVLNNFNRKEQFKNFFQKIDIK